MAGETGNTIKMQYLNGKRRSEQLFSMKQKEILGILGFNSIGKHKPQKLSKKVCKVKQRSNTEQELSSLDY